MLNATLLSIIVLALLFGLAVWYSPKALRRAAWILWARAEGLEAYRSKYRETLSH